MLGRGWHDDLGDLGFALESRSTGALGGVAGAVARSFGAHALELGAVCGWRGSGFDSR